MLAPSRRGTEPPWIAAYAVGLKRSNRLMDVVRATPERDVFDNGWSTDGMRLQTLTPMRR